MMNKTYKKFLLTAFLLLTVLSMLGTVVGAAMISEYSVTITYDADQCKTVILKVDGVEYQPTVTGGNEYSVPSQHEKITLEIVPATGYQVTSLKSTIQVSGGTTQTSECSLTLGQTADGYDMYSYSAPLDSDETDFSIECSEREYTVQVKPGSEGDHKWQSGISDPSGTTYFYTTDMNEYISLPIPTLAGYIFNGWMILPSESVSEGTLLSCKPGEDHVKLYKNTVPKTGGTLYLMPDWVKEQYYVYRVDQEFGTGLILSEDEHGIYWKMQKDSRVDGSQGEAKSYLGYYPFEGIYAGSDYYSKEITVQYTPDTDPYRNTVYRYYVPITYTLIYQGFEDDAEAFEAYKKLDGFKSSHTYNADDTIPQPTRVGYDFAGWQVFVGGVNITTQINPEVTSAIKNLPLNARQTYFATGNTSNEITLVATWIPKTYEVNYDWNGASDSDVTFDKSLYGQYTYDTALEIPNPIRKGYTLVGWELVSGTTTQTLTPAEGKSVLTAKTYTDAISLKAIWKANVYQITLNGNGAELATKPFEVTFDSAIALPADFAVPVLKGHKFLGFFTKDGDTWGSDAWIGADGKVVDGKLWSIDSDTVLYAKWEINQYQISVSIKDKANTVWGFDRVTVTVTDADTGVVYDYLNGKINYGTALKIRIELVTDLGYKLVNWNGVACDHAFVSEFTYTVEDKDIDLIGTVLPMIETPNIKVDYVGETITFDQGSYKVTCDGVTLDVTDGLNIRDSFFGKTMEIVVLGVAGESANRVITLELVARPDAPVLDDKDGVDEGEQIIEIIPTESTIVIEMSKTALEKYDFIYFYSVSDIAVRKDQWMDLKVDANGRLTIEGLSPGTFYYVYICIKAEDGVHPQGQVFKYRLDTEARNFVEDTKEALRDMFDDNTDGEFVQSVIDEAIEDIDKLVYPSATFRDEVQAILNRVNAEIVVARAKDVNISALTEFYQQLLQTQQFDTNGEAALKSIYDGAIAQIRDDATNTAAKVQDIANVATIAMKDVKVTYLYSGSNMLTFFNGLPQGTQLVLNPYGGYAHLIDIVNEAIQTGKIAVDGNGVSLQDLQTLDVLAYYQLKLTADSFTVTPANGVYEIRLHLPEALRGNQGLQVAYYNEKTGMLTVLDTEIDGNDLVFRSNKSGISDFIILGDTTVVMTSFIAALGLTLLCQLIAIVVLLVRRAKTSKSVRHCSLMLPLALTIRFLPENSMMLIFVLGILVVLAQIILMYLLFTSDVIYRKGKRVGNEPTEQRRERDGAPAEPADAPAPEVDDTTAYESISDEDTAVMVAFDDEEVEEDASQTDNEDEETTLDTPTEDLLEVEDESVAEDVFETEDESIVNDEAYDDFIEPAANPRYSLPDDEDLYVDTATGEIYSAAELNENDVILDDLETNEWDYDNASAEDEAEELSEDADAQNADASEWQYDDDPNEVAVSEDADTVLSDDDTKTYDGYEE